MKSPVIITPIGISEILLFAMSESEDVNILKVSWIAPKLNSENNIASPFHLFISLFKVCWCVGLIAANSLIYAPFRFCEVLLKDIVNCFVSVSYW